MSSELGGSRERGAWYADPFGSAGHQRWWDGSKWTKHVRSAPNDSLAPEVGIAAPLPADGPGSFRLTVDMVIGEELQLQRVGPKPGANYELVRGFGQRVARLSIGGSGSLARMECAAGEWRLVKRRRLGWELIIEAEDGRLVGWYSGRQWRRGGTILLKAGPQLELITSVARGWTLQTVEREEAMMRMRGQTVPLRVELLESLSRFADAHIAVLTACAIPLLEPQPPGAVS